MENLRKRLEKRGWRKQDIEKAIGIISKVKKDKSKENLFMEKRIYWVLLILITVANFAIAVALVPLLIALKGFVLYFIIITLGIVFGLLFELIIRTVEHLEYKHHLVLAFFIPLVALVNAFVISKLSNDIALKLNLENVNSSLSIALVYAVSFVLPYIIYRFVLKREYYAAK